MSLPTVKAAGGEAGCLAIIGDEVAARSDFLHLARIRSPNRCGCCLQLCRLSSGNQGRERWRPRRSPSNGPDPRQTRLRTPRSGHNSPKHGIGALRALAAGKGAGPRVSAREAGSRSVIRPPLGFLKISGRGPQGRRRSKVRPDEQLVVGYGPSSPAPIVIGDTWV